MKPASFDYKAPQSIRAALAVLKEHGDDAKIIAGGQSLVPMMNMRVAKPAILVDINALPELEGINDEGEGLAIGCLVRHHDLAHDTAVRAEIPSLAEAASSIGYYAIRQRGTIGGSIVQADPAAQLPLIAVLLDAELELSSFDGNRRIRAGDFFISVFTTAIEPTEILTTCRFQKRPANESWAFSMFSAVAGDYAIASAAATLSRDSGGRVAQMRLAVGGVSAVPLLIDTAAAIGADPSPDWISTFAFEAVHELQIDDSTRISAEYRRDVARAMVEDALTTAIQRHVRGN